MAGSVVIDEIPTAYEMRGSGPPLLLFAPGGFNAVMSNWWELGVYRGMGLIDELSKRYTCILFDRREAGRSGGRVERLGWSHYIRQGIGLLDHLGHESAHLMGGCVGCSIAVATTVAFPGRVRSLILYSPAGGPHYRMAQHDRFVRHLAFVHAHGPAGVVERARANGLPFNNDPESGPWATVLTADDAFANDFEQMDAQAYRVLVVGAARVLFDRDTVPGAEPEDLMGLTVPALIVPGDDRSHAPSAAHYLRETLANSRLWDAPVAAQNATTAPPEVLRFLDEAERSWTAG